MDCRLYHNPACSKSRAALALLRERGAAFRVVEYLKTPPGIDELRELASRLDTGVRGLLRTGDDAYTRLGLDDTAMPDERVLVLVASEPRLIERPLFVRGDRAVIGRPPERVLELLD